MTFFLKPPNISPLSGDPDVKVELNVFATNLSENAPSMWGEGREDLDEGLVDLAGKVLELMEGSAGWGKSL